jgi:hypothetical protein
MGYFKKICIILFSIVSFISFLALALYWALVVDAWSGQVHDTRNALEVTMKKALRMPVKRTYELNTIVKENDWQDLEPISDEEWRDVKCNYPEDSSAHISFEGSPEEIQHQNCISPGISVVTKQPLPEYYKNITEVFSINQGIFYGMFNSPCLSITFNEYILK